MALEQKIIIFFSINTFNDNKHYCNGLAQYVVYCRFGPPSPPISRASTKVPLTVLFLAATYGPKTRTTC